MASTTHTDESIVSVHRMPPRTGGFSELSHWEVKYGCEGTGWRVIGWIEEHHTQGSSNPSFFAIGIHPRTGKHYRLGGNIDFDERANTVADFHQNPLTNWQHLGSDAR